MLVYQRVDIGNIFRRMEFQLETVSPVIFSLVVVKLGGASSPILREDEPIFD